MAKNTNINVRTTEDIKKGAEVILNGLGLNISSAVNLFLKQVIITEVSRLICDCLTRKRYMLWVILKIIVILSQQIPLKKCSKKIQTSSRKRQILGLYGMSY